MIRVTIGIKIAPPHPDLHLRTWRAIADVGADLARIAQAREQLPARVEGENRNGDGWVIEVVEVPT